MKEITTRGDICLNDKLAAQEIFLDYSVKRINSTDASEKLGISKSTFLRRYREYENARQ